MMYAKGLENQLVLGLHSAAQDLHAHHYRKTVKKKLHLFEWPRQNRKFTKITFEREVDIKSTIVQSFNIL